MAIRTILRMGSPRLYEKSAPVNLAALDSYAGIVADMFDTMRAHDGVGLAAPQIGVFLRIVIFGFAASERYPDAPAIAQTILLNPEITITDQSMVNDYEGCLSVPGMRGLVARHQGIFYSGWDLHGNRIERAVSGFHARVVQHECDHLDGILYPLRIKNLHNFGFADSLGLAGDDSPEA